MLDNKKKNRINENSRVMKNAYQETQNFAKQLRTDPEKDLRLKASKCVYCYYREKGGVLAGQAFCDAKCDICDENETYSSTYTDNLCAKCAIDYNCCKHCGSDIELKQRKYYE